MQLPTLTSNSSSCCFSLLLLVVWLLSHLVPAMPLLEGVLLAMTVGWCC
jgi:hypothetical protein